MHIPSSVFWKLAATLGGAALIGGAKVAWSAKADSADVHTLTVTDSLKHLDEARQLNRIEGTVNDISTRLTQMQCGDKVKYGCR